MKISFLKDKKQVLFRKAALVAALGVFTSSVSANDFLCSAVGPTITDDVNGNVFVDVDCVVDGAFINGNMIQTVPGSNLDIEGGAEINGHLEFVDGRIRIRGRRTEVNGNVYDPKRVVCKKADVNGNIDDQKNCAGVANSCRVNGNVCGVGDGDDDRDD